ncbi:hypothetical protein FS842_000532 [Serendipita sp. 407]|nr:hypothetical protein FS842_000532 [Serendipita sp. 407]
MSQNTFEPSQSFHDAASFVTSSSQLKNLSNNTKLELYALYKMITVSRHPNVTKPSIFDMTGRAKWDAWDKAGKEYSQVDTGTLQEKYLDRCKELGWVPSASTTTLNKQVEPTRVALQEENLDSIDWDAPDDQLGGQKRSDKSMGKNVSVLQEEDVEIDPKTPHGLAILGDEGRLETLLQLGGVDINQRDEFGYTALHLAADRGNVGVVKLLIARGADPSIQVRGYPRPLSLDGLGGYIYAIHRPERGSKIELT